MKSTTKHYTLEYDDREVLQFETLVKVPVIGYCTFYAFKTCSSLVCHLAGYRPRTVGKAFRLSKAFVVDAFINRVVTYR